VTEEQIRDAGELLRAILAKVERGELTAPARVVTRLEGALVALKAAANEHVSQRPDYEPSGRSRGKAVPHSVSRVSQGRKS
jgi:hypothetical protein